MSVTAEVRTLALHPLAIHTFIKAQAGSLGKAMAEAAMNSIDAFAKNVTVELTTTGFVIEDDGQGFRNKDEIAAWFETLGFPHDDGNHRLYGKHGMGRAQLWAYAQTVWRSNEFVMKVDVKRNGLDYELESSSKPVKGTRIEATFYKELTFTERELVETELENLVRYVPGLVSVNDRVVSRDPAAEQWDLETPEAWMRFDKKMHQLEVYNAGVLVAHFPKYRFRCAGTICTKEALALNLARNDILLGECRVWPKIAKHFPVEDGAARKPVKSEKASRSELEQAGREALANTRTVEATVGKWPNMLTSVYGRTVPYSDLVGWYDKRPVVFVTKGSEFGKQVSKLRLAVVLDLEVLSRFGVGTPDEFKGLLIRDLEAADTSTLRRYAGRSTLDVVRERVFSDKLEDLFPEIASSRKLLTQTDLDEVGKAVLTALTRSAGPLRNAFMEVHRQHPELGLSANFDISQGFALGESVELDAWVSSTKHMALKTSVATKLAQAPMPELMRSMTSLLRGALIDKLGSEEADKVLLLWLTETEGLGNWALVFVSAYQRICREKDLPPPKTRLAELQKLSVE